MTIETLTETITRKLLGPLPGPVAYGPLFSERRNREIKAMKHDALPRKSGVLILLYPDDDEVRLVMIQRPHYDGVHSGQIAFPGGKMEDGDADLIATALREAEEETGIRPGDVRVLGTLSELFIAPSNFLVLPVIAISSIRPDFIPDYSEVSEILEFPLSGFLRPDAIQQREVRVRNQEWTVPCYVVDEKIVWGATAMIMSELVALLS